MKTKTKAVKAVAKAVKTVAVVNGCTRPFRKWLRETFGICLDVFGAYVSRENINRDLLNTFLRYAPALIAGFEHSKTERMVFVTKTVTEQRRRGTVAGICDVADVEIETNDGKQTFRLVRAIDDSKGEGGTIILGTVKGMRLLPLSELSEIARTGKIVQVKTMDRFGGPEKLIAGALLGNMSEKWQAIVHASASRTLAVHNINTGPMTPEETDKKLCDFSVQLGDLSETDVRTVRAQLTKGTHRTKAASRLKNSKKAHARKTAETVNVEAATANS